MIKTNLQFKVIFWIATILVILLGASFLITTTVAVNALNKEFEETTRRQAALLMDAIYNNIASTAEKGHVQQLLKLTEMVNAVSEIQQLVIFDQNGVVLQSIRPDEIGKKVSDIHYDVYLSNEIKGKVYDVGAQKEFCMVRPLFNQKRCHGCHEPEKRVLGILDVCLSMAPTQARIYKNRKIMNTFSIGAALITILLTSITISVSMRLMVTKPIGKLVQAINKVEQGDMKVLVKVKSADELGKMGHSFNSMVETIRKLNEMKDEFISIVSHELRTPLTSIKYFAEVLFERVKEMDQNKQVKYLKVINEETDRLTRLINDLLDLQKISSGQFKWKAELVEIPKIISSTVTTFSGGAASRSIRIITQLDENIPAIVGDRDKIVQLLANLLSNAIKFTRIGGKITIAASVGDNPELITDKDNFNKYILISVKDEGIGINRDNLHRIFEKFQQVEDAFTRRKGGTGLGLSISKEIVNHHGGRIWVESEVNIGSVFSFTLPYQDRIIGLEEGEADVSEASAPLRAASE